MKTAPTAEQIQTVPDVFTEFECFYSLVFGRNRHIPRVEIGTENVSYGDFSHKGRFMPIALLLIDVINFISDLYSKKQTAGVKRRSSDGFNDRLHSAAKETERGAKRITADAKSIDKSKERTNSTRASITETMGNESASSKVLVTYNEESEEESNSETEEGKQTEESQLPADFFDTSVIAAGNENAPETKELEEFSGGVIPEGFFDDPVMDAKVRKVEYRDKMDDEWDAFQKTIKAETQVSEALIEADDVDLQDDRQITEWTEQRDCFQRVENLLSQKDTVKLVRDRPAQMEDARLDRNSHHSESDSDDVDFDEFLDWRAKRV
ncbi:zinc finger protein 830-like [Corticium candelabrum]|uniref:zinc finger protein 830-like n=1 Tax=Corticium candelabrum TaxID=121492 RepID=UPI002E2701D2|nr:zinc finger protein 830-like [Corticium candelabrum]